MPSFVYTPSTSSPSGVPQILGLNAPWASFMEAGAQKYQAGLQLLDVTEALLDDRGGHSFGFQGSDNQRAKDDCGCVSPRGGDESGAFPYIQPTRQASLVLGGQWRVPPLVPIVFRPVYSIMWANQPTALPVSVDWNCTYGGVQANESLDPIQTDRVMMMEGFGLPVNTSFGPIVGGTPVDIPVWDTSPTIGGVVLAMKFTPVATIVGDVTLTFQSRIWISPTTFVNYLVTMRIGIMTGSGASCTLNIAVNMLNTTILTVANDIGGGSITTAFFKLYETGGLRAPFRLKNRRE